MRAHDGAVDHQVLIVTVGRERVGWYGGRFEPSDISVGMINERIDKLARRRMLGKAAFAKSRNKRN